MVRAGAAIVDVGGESTRPGAAPVTPEEGGIALGMSSALVEAGICVSVDTRHARWRLALSMPALPSSTTCLASAIPPWWKRCVAAVAGVWS